VSEEQVEDAVKRISIKDANMDYKLGLEDLTLHLTRYGESSVFPTNEAL